MCYAWTLSDVLTENYQTPERILVDAMSVFDDEEFKIATIDIDVQARVTGMEFEDYKNAAYQAEQICPISNALTAVFGMIDPLPTVSFAGKTEDISSRREVGGSTILHTAVRGNLELRFSASRAT